MKRRLLNLLTALSLLLSVAVLALWVRNGWRAETLRYNGNGVRLSLVSADGSIGVAKWQAPTTALPPHGRWFYWPTPIQWVLQNHPLPDRGPRGFAFGRSSDDGFGAEWWVAVPHWCLAAVLALPVMAWAWAHARRALTLLAGLSLLLCFAALAMWVRSYWVGETWDWRGWKGSQDATLASVRGRLSLYWQPPASLSQNSLLPPGELSHYATDPRGVTWHDRSIAPRPGTRSYRPGLGFGLFLQLPDPDGKNHVQVLIPYWFVTLMLAAPAALWLRSWRKRRRGPQVCRECGYDLRATPERCPECGTQVLAHAPA